MAMALVTNTTYLLKNLISNIKRTIFNKIFNSFLRYDVRYKMFRRVNRYFILGTALGTKIYN